MTLNSKPIGRPPKHIEPGTIFGRLTVLGPGIRHDKGVRFKCRCTCGDTKHVLGTELRKGRVKSCGCWQQEGRPRKLDVVSE